MNKQYELRNQEWDRVKYLFAPKAPKGRGRPAKDARQMLNAVLWVLGSGLPWRDLPPRYGEWSTVYKRYVQWKRSGVLLQVLDELGLGGEDEMAASEEAKNEK